MDIFGLLTYTTPLVHVHIHIVMYTDINIEQKKVFRPHFNA